MLFRSPVKTFYLRFLKKVQKLQSINKFPPSHAENFDATIASKFVGRLNQVSGAVVERQLTTTHQLVENVSLMTILDWVMAEERYRNTISLQKPLPVATLKHNGKPPKQHTQTEVRCHYCQKTDHVHKKDGKWTCPDKLANKPPSKQYTEWMVRRGFDKIPVQIGRAHV